MDPILQSAAEALKNAKLEELSLHSDYTVVEKGSIDVETLRDFGNDELWLHFSHRVKLRRMTPEERESLFRYPGELVSKDPDSVEESDRVRDRKRHEFHVRLTQLINEIGLENESGTPDHLLSDYLLNCLTAFERTVAFRAAWRGEDLG